jgi:hypothetical protein
MQGMIAAAHFVIDIVNESLGWNYWIALLAFTDTPNSSLRIFRFMVHSIGGMESHEFLIF